jgi:uncharacterized protein YkwD
MGQRGYFSHDTPKPYPAGQTGPAFTDRMRAAGYCGYSAAGENIASGQQTAQAVFNAWKNSDGHNANMLSANFTQIGIGHVVVGGRTYWTTDFAKPSGGGC